MSPTKHSCELKEHECTICFQPQPLQKYGDCGHKFCNFCINQMDKCPLCRKLKSSRTGLFSQDAHLFKLAKFIGL